MNSKTYKLPNGKKAVFEYDIFGIGKITLECMDELMGMIADRPQGEWIEVDDDLISCRCSVCGWEAHLYEDDVYGMPYCPNCGCRMKGADDE
jgi:hypothetical protein